MSRAVLLPHVASSVTTARQRLTTDLASSGVLEGPVDDAALIVSELLSNALRHAAPLPPPFPPESVQVAWRVVCESVDDGGWIEISVCDGGAETLPRIARPSLSALGGRGLGIVQCLAARWGTEVDDGTTTVWAILELPIDEVAGHRDESAAPVASAGERQPAPEPADFSRQRDTSAFSAAETSSP